MALVDILVLVIVVAAAVAGYAAWRRQVLVRELRASSPPGALVRPGDPLEVVQAKNRTWAMLEEAVRIFHQLMGQDEFMANLQPDTRASIERFLATYYQRNEGTDR
jgi:flagellar basal body-associated protein FliL